jgi:hypothetical protein
MTRSSNGMTNMRKSLPLALLTCLLVLATTAFVVPNALAVDKARIAVTLAQQASKSFETGDFARASELYLAAWKTDSKPDFLFGAARSAHLGGLADKAVELYGQYLATEGADPERQKRAREYLAELERAKVQSRVAEAERTLRDDPKVAAGLYLDAFKLAPTQFDLLFKAAVAEQSAHDLPASERLLQEYLAKAPANAPDRNQAQARLESMTRKAKENAEPAGEKPQPVAHTEEPRKETVPAPSGVGSTARLVEPSGADALGTLNATKKPEGKSRAVGWALVGSGTAVALGGLILYAITTPDISKYNAAMAQKDPVTGQVIGLSAQEAAAQHSSINARVGAGLALTGVGAIAAGVGAWWLLTSPPKAVTLLPGPGLTGASLAVRF